MAALSSPRFFLPLFRLFVVSLALLLTSSTAFAGDRRGYAHRHHDQCGHSSSQASHSRASVEWRISHERRTTATSRQSRSRSQRHLPQPPRTPPSRARRADERRPPAHHHDDHSACSAQHNHSHAACSSCASCAPHDHYQTPDRRGQIRVALIDACRVQTNFESDFQSCLARGEVLPMNYAVETVRACGDQTNFNSDFQSCLSSAATFRQSPVHSITACGNATSFGSDFRACLSAASAYSVDAGPVIAACGQATNFSSHVASCVETSRI